MIAVFIAWLERQPAKIFYPLAFSGGALLAFFALAPFNWGWLFFIFVPVMIWSLGVAKKPFWLGFAFGFGYNFVAFYWIAYAFLISKVAFLVPLSIVGLPALFGAYWGLAFWAAKKFWRSPLERVLSFSFFWTISFWLQGFLWTGFPWNFPAQVWIEAPALAQNFHWLGIYGANFIMILAAASFSMLSEQSRRRIILPLMSVGIFVALWSYGAARLAGAEVKMTAKEVVIVQPNILQEHKWDRRFSQQIIATYFQLSKQGIEKINKNKQAILIWPEAALPVDIERAKKIKEFIGEILPKNMVLMAGFVRFEKKGQKNFFNSLFVLDDKGSIISHYDKNHLVPFGEYLPLQKPLENLLETLGIKQIAAVAGSHGAGTKRELLKTNALPLICFEISFSEEIAANKRADWIVNVTNDGWYRNSPGPHQHFQLAQIRAIELGLPVVRAANTGISAIISPYGTVIKKLELEKQGIIHGSLPAPLPLTFYALWGEWLFVFFLVMNSLSLLILSSRK